MTKLIWHSEKRSVKSLKAWIKNPRKITREAFLKLVDRIRQRGFHDVIKIDTDGTILSGTQRKKALLELDIKEVTVLLPNRKLTKDEKDKIILESNLNDGEWDYEGLKSFDLDVLTDVGFDKDSLSDMWTKNLEVVDEPWDEEAEVKKAKETKIKHGDMFALGKHRLICGSSLDPEVVKKLMGETRANLIDIDMPFNINLSYDKGVGNRKNYGGTTNDNKTDEEYRLFVKTIMENALSVSKPDVHSLFWCDERFVWLFQILYKELGIDSKRLLIWLKNNSSPTPGVAFSKITEFCVYGTVGRPYLAKDVTDLHEVMNKNISTGNKVSEEILDQLNIWMVKRLPSNQYEHPTQKNPSLHEKALRRCTRPNDVVLDLTAGSGSIMSACDQLKRGAYMCGDEPGFCQVILNRFSKITGLNPVKL